MSSGTALVVRAAGGAVRSGGLVRRLVRRHWLVLAVLVAGAVLRALAVHAYRPAFSFPDSISYLEVAETGQAYPMRPWGYSGFLALLDGLVPFGGVVVVQHLLGLVVVVVVYALLQRRGVSPLVSGLAVVPVALDGYLIQLEHYLMAESLYILLLVGALALLLWQPRPPWWAALGAGLLLGLGTVTRTVSMVVIGVVAVYLVIRLLQRVVRWQQVAAVALGVVTVVLPYVVWFHGHTGAYAITDYTGHFLYGRVSVFADCDELEVPADLEELCPTQPVEERPIADWWVWDAGSPANSGRYTEDELTEYAVLVMRGQPVDYLTGTASNVLHYFMPGRYTDRWDYCVGLWQFPEAADAGAGFCNARLATQGYGLEPTGSSIRPGTASLLASYQQWGYTHGPLLGALALVGVVGGVAGLRRGSKGEGLDALLCVAIAGVVISVPAATVLFDYRYGLPIVALLPMGAALAARQLRPRPAAAAPDGTREPAPADDWDR